MTKGTLTVVTDDLSDVVLEGRQLVSDDPATWKVHDTFARFPTLLDGWQNLIDTEEIVHDLGIDNARGICEALDRWEYLGSAHRDEGGTLQAPKRWALLRMVAYGAEPYLIGMLIGWTEGQVREFVGDDNLLAMQMLKRGRSHADIEREAGVSDSTTRGWKKELGWQKDWAARRAVLAEAIHRVCSGEDPEVVLGSRAAVEAGLTFAGVRRGVYRLREAFASAEAVAA